jgi:hypothetical protein
MSIASFDDMGEPSADLVYTMDDAPRAASRPPPQAIAYIQASMRAAVRARRS